MGKVIYIQKGTKYAKHSSRFLVLPHLLSGPVVVLAGEVLHDLVYLAGHLGVGHYLGGETLQVGQGRRWLVASSKGRDELGGHLPGSNPPFLEGGSAHAIPKAANARGHKLQE